MATYYEAETPVGDGLANAGGEAGAGSPYYNGDTGGDIQSTDDGNMSFLWYALAFALGFTAAKIIK